MATTIEIVTTVTITVSAMNNEDYPVSVSGNGRYLIDQHNTPFLMIASSAQCMIINASLTMAETYLEDRQNKGINAIWVELLMDDTIPAGRADSSTYDSIIPFSTPGDISTPNETYFARADALINLAEEHGIIVLLTPMSTMAYLDLMKSEGTTKCTNFGAYLGNRYKDFPNIIWLNGEDFQTWSTQGDDDVVIALANGIKSQDTTHIHSIQLDYPTSDSREDSDWDDIISLNAVYRYNTQFITTLVAYNRTPAMPCYLCEAHYEGSNLEGDPGTPNVLRRQEYWSMLSGACGQLNGSDDIMHFETGWDDHLDDQGQTELTYLHDLFVNKEWYSLVPDQTHAILTAGYGTSADEIPSDSDYATCAAVADGSLAIIYMPDNRTMTVDMSFFSGSVTCRWYDPTDGSYAADAASPHANSGTHDFSHAGTNSVGDADWLLVLEA